ncbi:MAG TPA: RecQ family ATP-dependent DNA helicase [Ktedonobacteraceae bacterium]|nr:RecQ family ATP-dependent DNA helicase [Ktedonobacteraceae bacterium]
MGITWQNDPPEKLLAERFGITTGFYPGQRDIIQRLVEGKRVLAIQRTGWGKSLCYQMASLYYPNLTIVFSPLKALMRDQCQRCNEAYRIPSAIISSEFSQEENRATLELAKKGSIKILFIAPERLDNTDWQTAVTQMRISMIVVDEAHCISTWGHDFRPHYRRIVNLLKALPGNVPVLALTATANQRVEKDILQQIGSGTQVIRGTMQRPNLYLHVERLQGHQEKLGYLAQVLPKIPGTGIIYTATQRDAETVAAFLRKREIASEYYHAGREDTLRLEIQQKWMGNKYKAICSTNALGMGIDKQDIRFVIHYQIPASPIHYYQEVGRAGRDGKVSWCILLYDPNDLDIQEHFIQTSRPEGKHYATVLSLLRTRSYRLYDILRETGLQKNVVQTILVDLEEQHFIERNLISREYSAVARLGQINFSDYDARHIEKERELSDLRRYAEGSECYMEYLTTYLGDEPGYRCRQCGQCRRSNFPTVSVTERIKGEVTRFLEEENLPRIEKRGGDKQPGHEAGWALSYYGTSYIGRLVRASKYESAGPFAPGLVNRAVEVIRTRYPIAAINGIVSVPPTKSGNLVEQFARQVAQRLGIEYLPVVAKVRSTQEQKALTNFVQKTDNVKAAFSVYSRELVVGRSLLLIDDIYDSGSTLHEVARSLMQAGARVVYPLTITRTLHADDQ